MMHEFRQGFLRGASSRSELVSDVADGDFDIALLSSSWDMRCLSVTSAIALRAAVCLVFLPELRDTFGLRDRHDPLLLRFADRVGKSEVLRADSHDVDGIWMQLNQHLLSAFRQLGRSLKLFIDLSTCPRYLSLGLLSYAIKSGMASKVTLMYAEGDYPEEKSEQDAHELFTAGGWNVVPVPGLEGEWDPDKTRAFVVSVGFEGSKTLRLVSREEPDKVSLLFPDPGVKVEYVDRTLERNQALIRRFRITDNHIVRANAGDAIEAWQRLAHSSVEQPDEENIYYVCCGTKPHSLALAARGSKAFLRC